MRFSVIPSARSWRKYAAPPSAYFPPSSATPKVAPNAGGAARMLLANAAASSRLRVHVPSFLTAVEPRSIAGPADDRDAWGMYVQPVATPPTTLREITGETVRQITALEVAPEQDGLVAPNAVSIAEAYFEPKAWFRAIYFGEEPAGFVMVWRDPDERQFYIWRFMVDARFQGKGVGARALELLLDEARADGVDAVTLSVVPGERSAMAFYERFGFEPTGVVEHGEAAMQLRL